MKPALSSGVKTADAAIMAQSGYLCGLTVIADGTNAATVTLYDNASAASGTVLMEITVDATDTTEVWVPAEAIECANGIYADLTLAAGTARYIVHYTKSW